MSPAASGGGSRRAVRWLPLLLAVLVLAGAGVLLHLHRERLRLAIAEARARAERAQALLAEGRTEAARDQWRRALALASAARRELDSPAARLAEEIARGQAAERGASWRGRADAVGFGTGGEALAAVLERAPPAPDGGAPAAGGGAVRLVELSSGREQRRLACDLPPVSVELGRPQPGGGFGIDSLVLVRVAGGGARAFSLETGALLASLDLPEAALASPGAGASALVLWDRGLVIAPLGGGPRERLGGEEGDPAVQLGTAGGMALVLRRSGRLESWQPLSRQLVSVAEGVRPPLAAAPAGRASLGDGGALSWHHEGDGAPLGRPEQPAALVAVDGSGATLATAPAGDGPIELWSPAERRRAQVLPAPEGGALRLSLSEDGRQLIAAGPAAAEVWALPQRPRNERLQSRALRGLAFAASGLLVEVDQDQVAIEAIDSTGLIRRGWVTARAPAGAASPPLAISAGGLQLAVAADDGAHVVTLGSGGVPGFAARLAEGAGGVALSADGARLFTSAPGRLQAFEVRTEKPLWSAARGCSAVAFAAPEGLGAGGELLCAAEGQLLRLDPASGAERGRLGPLAEVQAIAVGADGALVAAAAAEGVRLLALVPRTARLPAALLPGTARATAVALSADGALLAAGTARGEVQLWDLGSGAWLGDYPRFAGAITALSFSPSGVALVAASAGAPGARFLAVPDWLSRQGAALSP